MFTLITGGPGSGKTRLAVSMVLDSVRPLYTMSFPVLDRPHVAVSSLGDWIEFRAGPGFWDPKLPYFTFKSGSLIVIDEAQLVFPFLPSNSPIPPYVHAFYTLDSDDLDFIVISQVSRHLDVNIRKLVDRHIHLPDRVNSLSGKADKL